MAPPKTVTIGLLMDGVKTRVYFPSTETVGDLVAHCAETAGVSSDRIRISRPSGAALPPLDCLLLHSGLGGEALRVQITAVFDEPQLQ